MATATFKLWRTHSDGDGTFQTFHTEVSDGMVVLDVVHKIQAEQAPDLAVRWNCKAGKCGSCSAEINGKPRLMCMTRLEPGEPATSRSRSSRCKTFPLIKDLVTDVSWNYRVKKGITHVHAAQARRARRHLAHGADGRGPGAGVPEVHRVLPVPGRVPRAPRSRASTTSSSGRASSSTPPNLEMHPLDTADRIPELKDEHGIGYCNITKCCTKVCPEHIHITDNAIIPLKERVVDRFYDPVSRLLRMVTGK